MSFTTPLALILLIAIPYVLYTGWPRYRFRRRRDVSSLILRIVMILLVVLALAGFQVVQVVDKLAVVFLVDVSDSMGVDLKQAQLDYIREAIENKPIDDLWGLVAFGANSRVDKTFSTLTEIDDIESTVVSTNTDIAGAIQTAIGMFPADVKRRIVILSDGQATLGDAESKAQLAAASGIEISYVHFARQPAPDVLVTALEAPNRVTEGLEFDISVTIEAEEDTAATLRIFSGGSIILEEDINLRAGTNNYTLPQVSQSSGFLDFSAQVVVTGGNDQFRQNNQLAAFSQVVGPPRVLVVTDKPEETQQLLSALQEAGIIVDQIPPGNLPLNISGLADYKTVMLVNIPATKISNSQMDLIDRYVKDLGGGLVFIGGPESYGPGGYFLTPMEQTLPVEMQIKDQQRLPQLTIAYLIDRSGSMAASGTSGVPNIELAKEAIIRSIDFLQPTDRAGVGSFDTDGSWIAEFQDVVDKRPLQRLVATLRAGGGTDILAGMQLIAGAIVLEPSAKKHIILLTDGGASQNGLLEITERLNREAGVTTSVIAIGSGAAPFLDEMAEAGQGKYHAITNVEEIPTIFTIETVLATRSYIIEEPFTPILSANSPIMDGINSSPPLRGYVATTPKSVAQVVLRGPDPFADPILVSWQYGLGRAVAFTSDATSRWGADWVTWEDFPRFWGQVVNWTITEGISSNLETRIVMENEQAHILVNARDSQGGFLNGLQLQTSLLNPQGQSEIVPLRQTAPGRYEAAFTPTTEGAYYLAVNGEGEIDGQSITFNQVNGWVMSYSPEYTQNANVNDVLLARLAEVTQGQSLSDTPNAVFAHTSDVRTAAATIWPFLLIVALALLPFDIAVRRLIITQGDLERLRAYLFRRREIEAERTERVTSLMDARERARQQIEEQTGSLGPIAALRQRKAERAETMADSIPIPSQGEGPRYTPKAAQPVPKTDEEGNIGAKLLKKRREREP